MVKDIILSNRKKGFTLIELLIVIAIIAILAAMLLPVLASAQRRAQGIRCLSNVKQLTLGNVMYVNDFGHAIPDNARTPTDTAPISGSWFIALMQYYSVASNSLLTCPICVSPPQAVNNFDGDALTPWCKTDYNSPAQAPYFGSYTVNGWFSVAVGAGGVVTAAGDGTNTDLAGYYLTTAAVRNPSTSPFFSDGIWVDMWPMENDAAYHILHGAAGVGSLQQGGTGKEIARTAVARHGVNAGGQNVWGSMGAIKTYTPAGINLGFYDGHAEFSPMLNLWNYTWHAGWGTAASITPQVY